MLGDLIVNSYYDLRLIHEDSSVNESVVRLIQKYAGMSGIQFNSIFVRFNYFLG